MSDDKELLRRYVEEGSESAFAELVREHVNLVYSAASRETNGDSGMAEDLTQEVFTHLAGKAHKLMKHPSPAGWLYTTVRHLAANARRSDQRRRGREEEVNSMSEVSGPESPELIWRQMRPVLDDALHEMNEADRTAIVLRYLEDCSLREVGLALGVQENTARMRVDRALEKLRDLLCRRGVTSSASGVVAALGAGAILTAPASLAATVAGTALASGVAATSTTLTLLKLMTLSKLKMSLAAALLVAGVAVPIWQQARLRAARSEIAQLQAQQGASAELREEAAPLHKAEAAGDELEQLRQYQAQTQAELLRLRGMAGVARRANAEAEELRAQLARTRTESGSNTAANPMSELMRTAMEQEAANRLRRMEASLHLTPDQAVAIGEILKRQSQLSSAGVQQVFSGKFSQDDLKKLAKDAGNPEEQIKALLTPEQLAGYKDYQQDEAAHNARLMANTELIQIQSSLGLTAEQQDQVFGLLYDVSLKQMTTTGATTAEMPTFANPAEQLQWVSDQKLKALEPVLSPAQLASYRQQQETQLKFMKEVLSKMQSAGR